MLQQTPPFRQIDQLRDHRRQFRQSVEIARPLRRVAAGAQHARGTMYVQFLAARLHGHGPPRQAPLEPHLVGDHPFQRCHMPGAAGDAVPVHIEAHREIVFGRGAEPAIEQQPLQRVDRQMAPRRFEIHPVPLRFQRARQHVDPDIGAAAAADIQRR